MMLPWLLLPIWFSVVSDAGVADPDRGTARRLHESGLAALRADRFDEAQSLLGQAAAVDRHSAQFANDFGFVLQRMGRRDEAEAELRRALDLDPARVYATLNLVDLLSVEIVGVSRRDEIVRLLQTALVHADQDPKARFLLQIRLTEFERSRGQFPAARVRVQAILESEGLTLAQRKRALDLREALQVDEGAAAFDAWPLRPVPLDDQALLERARALATSDVTGAIALLGPPIDRTPTFSAARTFRAQLLQSQRRYDEAARDLTIVVQLNPQDAEGWRRLGLLLAQHGGSLEAPRADEALRRALAIEPGFIDLTAARMKLAAPHVSGRPTPAGGEPTPRARRLFQEAEVFLASGDPTGDGRSRVDDALRESPGYVDAAVLRFAFTGEIADATVQILWNDGARLWTLTQGITRLSPNNTGQALVRPWVDRAATLGVGEALFARALLRQAVKDRAGAISDLTAYVGGDARPPRLDEARALRRTLLSQDQKLSEATPVTRARLHLFAGQPSQALQILGAPCTGDRSSQTLIELGKVYDFSGNAGESLHCYDLARHDKGPLGRVALGRLSAIAARIPDGLLTTVSAAALDAGVAAGFLGTRIAQARQLALAGQPERAAKVMQIDLEAPSPDPGADLRPLARELIERLAGHRATRTKPKGLFLAFGIFIVSLGLVGAWRWARRGRPLISALKREPALFPEICQAVGELRHDVLKHRTSVLDLATDPGADLAAVRSAILEPEPTSARVVAIYARLDRAARTLGVPLVDLEKDTVFGALVADLRQAERALRDLSDERALRISLNDISLRLRDTHANALATLLNSGPQTHLDATTLDAWLRAQAAAERENRRPWVGPALSLSSTDVTLPVDTHVLQAILSNLLRNAQSAVASLDDPRVIVRIDAGRDVTGQATVSVLVGDVASADLGTALIESRPRDRGLGIVRDLAQMWRGRVVITKAEAPFTKMVGVTFQI